MTVTDHDHQRAAAIASEAGELLLEVRASLEEANAHPRYVKDAGDRVSHDFIVDVVCMTGKQPVYYHSALVKK